MPDRSPLRLIDASFEGRATLGTGVSAAILRRVARGEIDPTMRIHRTGRVMAFGRIDRLAPGYAEAVRIAREHGYESIERMAGGRAAVFSEGTIALARSTRTSGFASGTTERFEEMAETIAGALRRLGVDARIGEVPGEYCPGAWSVSDRGVRKLAGLGQRTIAGGAHIGGVVVVGGAEPIRAVLEPVYEALGLSWDPETVGSVTGALGAGESEVDELTGRVVAALREELAERYEVREAELDEPTMRLAEELRDWHRPAV
jgi:octanoyl-[GcvH]:protein N-octanoyltransferase